MQKHLTSKKSGKLNYIDGGVRERMRYSENTCFFQWYDICGYYQNMADQSHGAFHNFSDVPNRYYYNAFAIELMHNHNLIFMIIKWA